MSLLCRRTALENAGGNIFRRLFKTLVWAKKEVPQGKDNGKLAAKHHGNFKN